MFEHCHNESWEVAKWIKEGPWGSAGGQWCISSKALKDVREPQALAQEMCGPSPIL